MFKCVPTVWVEHSFSEEDSFVVSPYVCDFKSPLSPRCKTNVLVRLMFWANGVGFYKTPTKVRFPYYLSVPLLSVMENFICNFVTILYTYYIGISYTKHHPLFLWPKTATVRMHDSMLEFMLERMLKSIGNAGPAYCS